MRERPHPRCRAPLSLRGEGLWPPVRLPADVMVCAIEAYDSALSVDATRFHVVGAPTTIQRGTWGRSYILSNVEGPRAGGHGGCPPINPSFLAAEQPAKDAQPSEASS